MDMMPGGTAGSETHEVISTYYMHSKWDSYGHPLPTFSVVEPAESETSSASTVRFMMPSTEG